MNEKHFWSQAYQSTITPHELNSYMLGFKADQKSDVERYYKLRIVNILLKDTWTNGRQFHLQSNSAYILHAQLKILGKNRDKKSPVVQRIIEAALNWALTYAYSKEGNTYIRCFRTCMKRRNSC